MNDFSQHINKQVARLSRAAAILKTVDREFESTKDLETIIQKIETRRDALQKLHGMNVVAEGLKKRKQ